MNTKIYPNKCLSSCLILLLYSLPIFTQELNAVVADKTTKHPMKDVFISSTGGWGGNFSDSPSAEWDIVVGQILNKRLWLGMGAGINFNSVTLPTNRVRAHHFIPLFVYGRYYLNDSPYRLFTYSRIGYGFPLPIWNAEEHNGGLQFQPGIGLHFTSRSALGFLITLGQNIQYTTIDIPAFDLNGDSFTRKHSQWYNRTTLKIGLSLDGLSKKN
ncbi:MAG: hypothetical protein AAGJ18_09445 [Bacteroidota bacterium]